MGEARSADATSPEHTIENTNVTKGGLTIAAFNQRLEDAARRDQQRYAGSTVDRIVQFDLAFPRDANEYKSFGKYGLLLVSALSHDASELPLVKVYIQLGGSTVELQRVVSIPRDVGPKSIASSEYGQYREDAFYLLPAGAVSGYFTLLADFAVHRSGFVLTKGPLALPDFIKTDATLSKTDPGPLPTANVFVALLRREYPGFTN
jgi:hypothetical protein